MPLQTWLWGFQSSLRYLSEKMMLHWLWSGSARGYFQAARTCLIWNGCTDQHDLTHKLWLRLKSIVLNNRWRNIVLRTLVYLVGQGDDFCLLERWPLIPGWRYLCRIKTDLIGSPNLFQKFGSGDFIYGVNQGHYARKIKVVIIIAAAEKSVGFV